MQGLAGFILRRLLWLPIVLLIVSFFAFVIVRLGPGDYVDIQIGQHSDPETTARIREAEGLNEPIIPVTVDGDAPFVHVHKTNQYSVYVWNLLRHGDFGESATIYRGVGVWEIIWPRMLVSMQPGIIALVVAFTVGTTVGIFAALRQGTWLDPFAVSTFLFFQSVPILVVLPFLMLIFVVQLGWLPAAGWEGPRVDVGPGDPVALGIFSRHIILPAIVLSLPGVAGIARLVRATTLQVLGEDYVRTARAKGLREFTVVSQHVARNSLLPLVTIVGLSLVTLLEGAFFTETILGIPGIGRLGFQAATSRDYDLILALVLILAFAFIVANLITDIAYTFIDPRVRYSTRRDA